MSLDIEAHIHEYLVALYVMVGAIAVSLVVYWGHRRSRRLSKAHKEIEDQVNKVFGVK